MTIINYRNIQILLAFTALFILTCSLCFQYVLDMEPCPLCLMQRLAVILLLIMSTIGIFVNKSSTGKRIAVTMFLIAGFGLYFASRQLWLQSLPPGHAPACMPGMDVLIQYFPWKDILHALLFGDGDCAEVRWTWLGLTMPAWAAVYFVFTMMMSIVLIRERY